MRQCFSHINTLCNRDLKLSNILLQTIQGTYIINMCIMKTELTQPFYKLGPCNLCYIVDPSIKHLVRNEGGSQQIKKNNKVKIAFVVFDLCWKREKKTQSNSSES